MTGPPHCGPHITPRGLQGLLCAGERRAGAPAPGGESFPPKSPAPSGSARARAPDARCLHRKGRLLLSPGGNRPTHADPKPAPRRPIWERPGRHCTLGSRKPRRASKSCGARGGAARLTCEARQERAEPKQTGVEGRGYPRHGARRSAGTERGRGQGPQPHAGRCAPAHGAHGRAGPRPAATILLAAPAGTPGVVAASDAPSSSPRASAPGAPSLLPRPPAPTLLCFLLPSLPRAATRSVYS